MREIKAGMRLEWRREITEDDVRRFTQVSGDAGAHHIEPDAQGRVLAQGLLTATLPTKLGGDLNFIAREMKFEFLRPVYSGDGLHCLGIVDAVVAQPKRLKVSFSFEVANQHGKIVMKGSSTGMILRPREKGGGS